MGTSTEPGVVHLAHQREDLGPLAVLGPDAPEPLGALLDDERHGGPGLHVVQVGRTAPDAAHRGPHVLGPGRAHSALYGRHERAGFAAHEGAGAPVDGHVEREAGTEDVRAQQPVVARLLERHRQVLHRDRVLLPHVDEAFVGPDGVGSDDQALQHPVRVAFEQTPVHIGARVALVGVDHHVLDVARGVPRGLPLDAGREAPASAASEFGGLDLVEHLFGRHLEEGFRQRLYSLHRRGSCRCCWGR